LGGLKLVSAGHGETGNYIGFAESSHKELPVKVRAALIKMLNMPWQQKKLRHYPLANDL